MGHNSDLMDAFTPVRFDPAILKLKAADLDRTQAEIFRSMLPISKTPRKVIYNPPATIILWTDGRKTVVKCSEDDAYDPITGFLLCCLKHFLGADEDPAVFHRFLREHAPSEKLQGEFLAVNKIGDVMDAFREACQKAAYSVAGSITYVARSIREAFEDPENGGQA